MERSLAKIENEIAKARLDGVKTQAWNEGLDRDIAMYKKEIDDKNKIITKSESEIRQRVLIIEHKQGQIDLYNKKIEHLIEKAGVNFCLFSFKMIALVLFLFAVQGVELGPLELEEKNLNKEIDDLLIKIMELEQKWLREQNELVRLIKDRQTKGVELKGQKDNFVVFTTKKMRIESK